MKTSFLLFVALVAAVFPRAVAGRNLTAEDLKKIGYDQHIGQPISANLMFQDSEGRRCSFGQLLNGHPTILVLGYYHCPMLCTLINDGLIEALQELRLDVGRDFNIVNISIDQNETAEIGAAKKKEYLRRYGRPGAAEHWHFLTADQATITQLTREAGFRFRYDPATHQYAHPSGFLMLTPDGRISRYFFGVNFDPGELRKAIIAAGQGERGSLIHQLVLLCCQYNPVTGKYGALVLNVVRAGAVLTLVALGWAVVQMSRHKPRPKKVEAT